MTRLLGQSPSGLSATGESDVLNYYDIMAARQELDLRPQLERLDRLICWSENIDEGALTFAFRPLWQLDEPARAALALAMAQATQVYAGLKLGPAGRPIEKGKRPGRIDATEGIIESCLR